jgi:hypothetical protein
VRIKVLQEAINETVLLLSPARDQARVRIVIKYAQSMVFRIMEIRLLTQKTKEDAIRGDSNSIIYRALMEIWDQENLITVIYAKINKLMGQMPAAQVFSLCYVDVVCQLNRRNHNNSNKSQVDRIDIW